MKKLQLNRTVSFQAATLLVCKSRVLWKPPTAHQWMSTKDPIFSKVSYIEYNHSNSNSPKIPTLL